MIETKYDHQKSAAFWSACYTGKNLFWHVNTSNPILVDNYERLCGGEKRKKFFVPLSGKSLDIQYLLRQGHQVFALDAASKAIEELNEECQFGLKFNEKDSIYSTDDGRLQIFCGDFTTCPIEKFGPFDCVWDRWAFTAIDYQTRQSYKEMMQRGLQKTLQDGSKKYHDFRYLLVTVDYDRTKFDGAPRAVSEEEIKEYFGDWTNFEMIHGQYHPDVEMVVQQVSDLGGEVTQNIYFLTPK